MKKSVLIFSVIIVVLLSLGMLLVWNLYSRSSRPVPKSAGSSEPVTTQLYTGTDFTFEYPSNFVVMDNSTQPETQGEIQLSVQMDGTQDNIPWGALGISTTNPSGLGPVLNDIYNISVGDTWSNPTYQVRYTRLNDVTLPSGVAHVYEGSMLGDNSQSNILRIISHNNKFYVFNQVVNTSSDLKEGDLEYQVPFDQIFFDLFSSVKFN